MKGLFRFMLRKWAPDSLEKKLVGDGALEETVEEMSDSFIGEKIKDFVNSKTGHALEVVEYTKDLKPEVDAVEIALQNLSEAMKQKALASKAEWDDAPAIAFDEFVDNIVKFLKGVPLF